MHNTPSLLRPSHESMNLRGRQPLKGIRVIGSTWAKSQQLPPGNSAAESGLLICGTPVSRIYFSERAKGQQQRNLLQCDPRNHYMGAMTSARGFSPRPCVPDVC